MATEIQKVRRTGLTFAPEGGTWRIRQVLNKLIREEDLYDAVDAAFSQGWRRMKLYFLIGVPTEMDEDTLGIAELARTCVEVGRRHNKAASVTASVGGFVPKPHTPFQWFGQNTVEDLRRKVNLLRTPARHHGVQLRWHDPEATLVEGIASRGDRRLGPVIEDVWRAGGVFQEWSEHFDLSLWKTQWRATASRSTGTSTGTAPTTRCCRGTTSRPASIATSCGRTGRTRCGGPACRTAGGRLAMTAVSVPVTASSTWWPRPPRRQEAARARAKTCRRGGDGAGGRCFPDARREPTVTHAVSPCGVRFSKLGKVRFTPATAMSLASASGRCAGPSSPVAILRGVLPSAPAELRPGSADWL